MERLDYVVPARSEEDRQDDSTLSDVEVREELAWPLPPP